MYYSIWICEQPGEAMVDTGNGGDTLQEAQEEVAKTWPDVRFEHDSGMLWLGFTNNNQLVCKIHGDDDIPF